MAWVVMGQKIDHKAGILGLALSISFGLLSIEKELPQEHGKKTRWGGNVQELRPEAIIANEASRYLNNLYKETVSENLESAVVVIPAHFVDSQQAPYGDSNNNASVDFADYPGRKPPLVAVQRTLKNPPASFEVTFFVDKDFLGERRTLELAYFKGRRVQREYIQLSESAEEIHKLEGCWTPASSQVFVAPMFVRPGSSYNDWLVLDFNIEILTKAEFISRLTEEQRHYDDGKSIIDPENLKATDMQAVPRKNSLLHRFTDYRYNVERLNTYGNPEPYYVANVHGSCLEETTAVSYTRTWVAERRTPFKTLYSCFDGRRVSEEARFGVPTAIGWHVVGQPTAVLGNTLEKESLLVAQGYVRPWENHGLKIPSHAMTYGITDSVVFALLPSGHLLYLQARQGDAPLLQWVGLDNEVGTCVEVFFPE